MDITPLIPKERQVIERYGDGGFVINGMPYKGNILLAPEQVARWEATDIATATPESLAALFTSSVPEILLIGTGARFAPLPAAVKSFLSAKKVATDVMDTGAACRTYTVLLAEGREVCAALIAV